MKTIRKTTTLRFEKFQIAKLTNLNTIIGGKAFNNNSSDNEEEELPPTTGDTFPPTITTTTIGG